MTRRVVTARDQVEMLSPWRTAMPVGPLPDGVEFKYDPAYLLSDSGDYSYAQTGGFVKWPSVRAVHNGDVVGHISWKPNGEIKMIRVHPDYQRRGLATRLFDMAKDHHPELHHSPWKSDDGEAWSDYEKSRHAAVDDPRHPDLHESLRLHGVVHTTGGRRLAGQRLATADQRTQETRLLDPRGWQRHPSLTPSGLAVQGARAYAGLVGLDDPHQHDYSAVEQTPQTVRTVGRLYDGLPAHDRAALPHYEAMRREVANQHDFMTNRLGLRVESVDHDPYPDVHH